VGGTPTATTATVGAGLTGIILATIMAITAITTLAEEVLVSQTTGETRRKAVDRGKGRQRTNLSTAATTESVGVLSI